MKSNPWLTIIIPVYNAEKYLGYCLDSILQQSFTNYEVILVDDGSLDNSYSICKKYSEKDDRIHCYKKENGGPYQARIYGAKMAKGTYITFCDADDYYASKEAFAILYQELYEEKYDVLQFGYYKKYNHLKRKGYVVEQAFDVNRDDFLMKEYPKLLCSKWEGSHLLIYVWNKVYHKNMFHELPNSEDAEQVFMGEDLILNLQLLENCRMFRFIPNVLYGYRQLSGGTSKFSAELMYDLDKRKKYQLMYLKHYQGDEKEKMQRTAICEIAGWFFVYIQQALDYLTDKELHDLISDILKLESFVLARKYFLNRSGDDWEAANLLRKADAQEYIVKAKIYKKKCSVKEKIYKIMKYIYAAI